MERCNLKEGLVIQRLYSIGSSFRATNNDNGKKRVLSLAHRNFYNEQFKKLPEGNSIFTSKKEIRSESPLKRIRPLKQFYRHYINAIEMLKNKQIQHLKQRLQEKERLNQLAKKRSSSTRRAIIGQNKILFCRTQLKVNDISLKKIKMNSFHNKFNDRTLVPTISQASNQVPIEEIKLKCSTTTSIKQPTCPLQFYEAYIGVDVLNCTERSNLSKRKRAIVRKNHDHLRTISKKARTPRCCYQSKRIIYTPRSNSTDLPLVIINFEGVLGDVSSKKNMNEVNYIVKSGNLNYNQLELGTGLKQLMNFYRVVLHFSMPKKLFKVFYSHLKKSKVIVDAIYKSYGHTYYFDYSQILLDFDIDSYEALGKRVLFITSLDVSWELVSSDELIDKSLANPDLATLCSKVPLIYAIEKLAAKYSVKFDVLYNDYYEPITLLVPSILSQRKGKAFSMSSLVKAVNMLSFDLKCPDFLKGVNECSYKSNAAFIAVESGVFWKKLAQQKEQKAIQISHLNDLNSTTDKSSQRLEPLTNNDPAVTFIYLKLLELNFKVQEALKKDSKSRKVDASFSDEEFDEEARVVGDKSRVNIFAIPSAKHFENSVIECIKTEESGVYKLLFI